MLSHVWRASLGFSSLFGDPCQRNLWKTVPHPQAPLVPQESDNNQSLWKKLPHGCSGGFVFGFRSEMKS